MAYVSLWDVIQDQLWSYQDQNILKENIDYLANNVFGITVDGNTGAPWLKLRDSQGFEFDGGTTKYLKPNAAATYLELAALDLKVTSPKYIKGERGLVYYWCNGIGSTVYSTSRSTTLALGYVMPHAGSLLTISHTVYTSSFVGAGSSTERADVYKNGSLLVSGTATASLTTGSVNSVKDEYTRGTHSWVAGDRLEILHTKIDSGGGGTLAGVATVELEVTIDA